MKPQDREQIRLSILRFCLSPCTAGLAASYLRSEGFRVDAGDVGLEIVYLTDKGLLVSLTKKISPEVSLYRTTADGRDFLATQGHEQ